MSGERTAKRARLGCTRTDLITRSTSDGIPLCSLNSYIGLSIGVAVLLAILYELWNGAILATYKSCGGELFRYIVFGLFLGA